jgi:hypothetical protein
VRSAAQSLAAQLGDTVVALLVANRAATFGIGEAIHGDAYSKNSCDDEVTVLECPTSGGAVDEF